MRKTIIIINYNAFKQVIGNVVETAESVLIQELDTTSSVAILTSYSFFKVSVLY